MTVQLIEVQAPTGPYTIAFGSGALDQAGELLRQAAVGASVAIVCSQPVRGIYASRLADALTAAEFRPTIVEIPDGESAKCVETLAELWTAFQRAGLDRRSAVIGLGGGVVGDVAGFAAATYMRGVTLIQAPTTLLALVDASIGGKVAVDHGGIKNLVGAFHNPRLVIADPELLATLPDRERRGGLAEVIKHAAISSAEHFSRLEIELAARDLPTDATLAENLRVKVGVVGRDPFERGERAILNFGHTFGHAIEAVSEYRLSHGFAVAIGMVAAARTSERLGLLPAGLSDRLIELLRRVGLPTACPELRLDQDAVRQAMSGDKKSQGGRLRLILLRDLGRPEIVADPPEALVRQGIAEMVG